MVSAVVKPNMCASGGGCSVSTIVSLLAQSNGRKEPPAALFFKRAVANVSVTAVENIAK